MNGSQRPRLWWGVQGGKAPWRISGQRPELPSPDRPSGAQRVEPIEHALLCAAERPTIRKLRHAGGGQAQGSSGAIETARLLVEAVGQRHGASKARPEGAPAWGIGGFDPLPRE